MSIDTTSNNKRIAKNTFLLYVRMILLMFISLFTSRVLLQTLGVTDYGIYNVVGGVITMFAFLTSAMSSSTQRYITYYLGKGNEVELNDVFSISILIHFIIALVILFLGETIGLWFVLNKLVIPIDRTNAALWVYQFSVLTFFVNVISIPYNAAIIAHEKMSAFAYISILDVVLKLSVVFLLSLISYDKLKTYAVLLAVVAIIIRVIYGVYCSYFFSETHYRKIQNKALFKEMVFFAGWNLWGGIASVFYGQGLNILLNIFFGPVVNAARGIAVQVQSAAHLFATNFQMAINPQITKTYAANKTEEMHNLIFRSSKFTFFLLLIICLPLFMETHTVLELWLGEVPESTAVFVRFMLIVTLLDSMANPLMNANAATGQVKVYQSVIGGMLIMILPISYIVLKLGGSSWSVFLVHVCVCVLAFVARLLLVRPLINLSLRKFFYRVIMPCFYVFIFSIPVPFLLWLKMDDNFISCIVVILFSAISAVLSAFAIGLSKNERAFVIDKLKNNPFKVIISKK